MQTVTAPEIALFYICAPEDQEFCEGLEKHLAAMKRSGWIRTWHHRSLEAGQVWRDEVKRQLAVADIILLLISADFLASDYCYGVELQDALHRHELGEVIIVPVIVRPVDWSITPFQMLHALPTDGEAVVNWANRDQAFFVISQELRRLIEQRRQSYGLVHEYHRTDEPLWSVPYRQNPFFTGRGQQLEQLSSYFSSWKSVNTPIAALYGIGGIGKTQVALEYAYQSSNLYQAVFWVNASSQETLVADCIALADVVGLPLTRGQDASTVASLVRRWLSNHLGWLLVFDAVSDLSLVKEMIPVRSSGHVLLTTQAPISKAYACVLEMEKLFEQEALALLLRRAGLLMKEQSLQQADREAVQEARQLCLALDGLPLALDQAGAYIEETRCGLAGYYRCYQQQQLTLLSQRGDACAGHPTSLVAAWNLSFAQLEAQDVRAADLLRACAFLAPEVIPQQIFLQGAASLGPHIAGFLTNETHFDCAVKTLRQFALVNRFAQTQTISLHRLVQVVLRSQMTPDVQAVWAQRVAEAICATFPGRGEREWARCSLYIPHLFACEKMLEEYRLDATAAGAPFYRAGYFFHDHAQYAQAQHLYQQALRIFQASSEETALAALASIFDSLGWLALDQGEFSAAEGYFRRAQALKEEVYGYHHLEMAKTLHALGRLAHARYQYEQAKTLYQQALQIKERSVGSEQRETATTLHMMAWLLQDQGQYDAASAFYQRAFAIRAKALGPEHVSMSSILHQLARIAHHRGQHERAEELYLQSLAIKEKALGPEHPFIAIGMDALARLYQEQERPEEAETCYQRALTIREQYFGPEHHFTAEVMHHLACLYQEQGQFQRAEALLLQALDIREQRLGASHPLTAISLHQLARFSVTQQHWERAERLYQRVLAIREETFGPEHPATQSVVKGYTRLLRSLQRDAEAQALQLRAGQRCS